MAVAVYDPSPVADAPKFALPNIPPPLDDYPGGLLAAPNPARFSPPVPDDV